MKEALLILFLALTAFSVNSTESEQLSSIEAKSEMVYICTSEKAYAYHRDPNCRGLGRCKCAKRKVTLSQAKRMGKDKPCGYCY